MILPTMPSAMTQESTGSAIQCTSTGSSVASPLLARNTGDFVARDTCTTRPDLQEGQTGRGTTLSLFAAIVDPLDHIWCFCYYRLCFISVLGFKNFETLLMLCLDILKSSMLEAIEIYETCLMLCHILSVFFN